LLAPGFAEIGPGLESRADWKGTALTNTETGANQCSIKTPRVLLINDSSFQLESLRLFLTKNGFTVETANEGRLALEMVRLNPPDLVISDVVMPGIDGVELCKRLKADPATSEIPVLLLTGLRYNDAGVVEGLEAGADDYLELEAPPSLLLKKAERLVSQHRERLARLRAEADRKKALENLKDAVELREAIFQGSRDAIFISNAQSEFMIVNRAACELTGYSSEELLKMRIPDLHEEVDLKAFRKFHDRIMSGEDIVSEAKILRKDGKKVITEFNNRRIFISGRPCMHTVARDVTERNQMEDALRQSEEQYRDLYENANDIIYTLDLDGNFTSANKAAERLFGYSREELMKMSRKDIVAPDHLHIGPGMVERRLAGEEIPNYCGDIIARDGRRLTIETSVRLLYRDGMPVGIQGIARDITERKLAEEQLKQFAEKLEKSNRELEGFAYIASHDLQEPLRKIQAFGDRLKAKCGHTLNREAFDYLDRMQGAAKRMQTLVIDLLKLSRVTTRALPFVRVDLAQIVKEVVSDLELQIEQTGGTVKTGYLPTIEADPTQMRQLFQNLIGNALKFHRPGDSPIVRVEDDLLCERDKRTGRDKEPTDFCRIIIEDNGIGFDEKYIDRIFAPFQRLHGRSEYDGTGIGLTVCQKIAQRHNGTIFAESAPGDGARFVISLPMRQSLASQPD
jgi:two-component system sensor kinase FixL